MLRQQRYVRIAEEEKVALRALQSDGERVDIEPVSVALRSLRDAFITGSWLFSVYSSIAHFDYNLQAPQQS